MTSPTKLHPQKFRFGNIAYLGAAISLLACFGKATIGFVTPVIGLSIIELDPHLQAIIMWGFAAISVAALFVDLNQHGELTPLLLGAAALVIIMATLYTFYHDVILATGYVLLLIASFLNQNRTLAYLNKKVQAQADEITEVNSSLERRVTDQFHEIERLARLKRFLPGHVADLITTEGKESLLESHRGYIACLFCDIRRFTSMTKRWSQRRDECLAWP